MIVILVCATAILVGWLISQVAEARAALQRLRDGDRTQERRIRNQRRELALKNAQVKVYALQLQLERNAKS